ncbi:MAG: hypothetical protein K6G50_01180, partial [bacterium]|nr:hypothetical protein [bacterium]
YRFNNVCFFIDRYGLWLLSVLAGTLACLWWQDKRLAICNKYCWQKTLCLLSVLLGRFAERTAKQANLH